MTRLLVVNVLLGIPGILYYWMLYAYFTQGSMATIGSLDFSHRIESYFSSNQVLGPPLAIGAIIWILVNVYLVNRRKRHGDCQNATGKTAHWLTAFASTLLAPLVLLGAAAAF